MMFIRKEQIIKIGAIVFTAMFLAIQITHLNAAARAQAPSKSFQPVSKEFSSNQLKSYFWVKCFMDAAFCEPTDERFAKFLSYVPQILAHSRDFQKEMSEITKYTSVQYLLEQVKIAHGLSKPSVATSFTIHTFDECNCSRLSRIKDEAKRGQFEEMFIDRIDQNFHDKTQRLVYVSLASGFLFQDFVIISKLLERGFHNIDITFIDPIYTQFIHEQKEDPTYKSCANCFAQFGGWLGYLKQKIYLDAEITFNVYSSTDDYLQDIHNGNHAQANILAVIDLDVQGAEQIIQNAYDNILAPGGLYAFFVDIFGEQKTFFPRLGAPVFAGESLFTVNDRLYQVVLNAFIGLKR